MHTVVETGMFLRAAAKAGLTDAERDTLSLPNSPGLVGQVHAAIKLGLSAYLPLAVVNSSGIAYASWVLGVEFA